LEGVAQDQRRAKPGQAEEEMKLDELIVKLAQQQAEHGDVDAVHSGRCGGATYNVDEVIFIEEENAVHIY
jgi:hypothetical protein